MPRIDRRTAIAGAFATAGATVASSTAQDANDQEPTADQKFVIEAGMTEEEAECWRLIAEAAGAFFKLPVLHPMDKQEVATAIHVVQNKLLARPTYRKYLELAKAARGDK